MVSVAELPLSSPCADFFPYPRPEVRQQRAGTVLQTREQYRSVQMLGSEPANSSVSPSSSSCCQPAHRGRRLSVPCSHSVWRCLGKC